MKLSLPPFRRILGALRICRERAIEVGQPGLAVWTGAGEQAAAEISSGVAQLAHQDEVADLEAKREIDAGLADLAGGKNPAAAVAHFKRAERFVTRSADDAHDISEVMKS